MTQRVACFGGIYSNYLALQAAIADAETRSVDGLYCLGDLGAFGPFPDRVFPILQDHRIACVQGNYDDSIGHGLSDCQCGYTDPRDNYFADLSYRYTLANTSSQNRAYLRALPKEIRLEISGHQVLLCHGSPRQTNEFLWESTTSDAFLAYLMDRFQCDVLVVTHTGIPWVRKLNDNRLVVNCGALGRPANDGRTDVWYAMLELSSERPPTADLVPVAYDYECLAQEMEQENLPSEFVDTIRTGWWTTCLEVLPAKERRRGQF